LDETFVSLIASSTPNTAIAISDITASVYNNKYNRNAKAILIVFILVILVLLRLLLLDTSGTISISIITTTTRVLGLVLEV